MLEQVQQLSTLCFASGEEYDGLRRRFLQEVTKLRGTYGVDPDLPHKDKERAADIIDNAAQVVHWNRLRAQRDPTSQPTPNIIDDSKSIMIRYTKALQSQATRQRGNRLAA